MNYPFKKVEQKWQKNWETQTYPSLPVKKKKYVLEMLPYPSGNLHMGHVRNYTIGDAIARFHSMKGFDVLHPMGFDAFGLPAENAAIERGINPKDWTYSNIEDMVGDLKKLGFSYDWSRKFATCDPSYFKHEQQFFIDFYKKGLIYQKESYVNFDPVENTVLANEQVVNGRGWRSGAVIERKKLKQWFCKITDYADELLADLTKLDWPEKVLKMQENWIGKSRGALIHFSDDITVYTTRPDTIFGASFIAMSALHPICLKLAKDNPELAKFIEEIKATPNTEEAVEKAEKKGFDLKFTVDHPFDSSRKIPVYAANFVLMEYGTGVVFGCPAHDERDHEFTTKYNLPIKTVVDENGILIESDFLNGLTTEVAKKVAIEKLNEIGKGEEKTQYRLRDWGISRQRYWGCPIPMVYCNKCGIVPETNLPIELPYDINITGQGNPLDHHPTWKHTTCPTCKGKATRETDTLDTFFESSWYFLRYCSPQSEKPVENIDEWMPVDIYIGGIEHAVMHLLYARFFVKALTDLGYINVREPFKKLITQGMVCHKTYKTKAGKFLYPQELPDDLTGIEVGRSEKMSKSKRNVINPDDIINSYGADTTRLFILSDTPIDKDFDWNEEGLEGCYRYTNRVWRLYQNVLSAQMFGNDTDLQNDTHKFIQKITTDYEKHEFNIAIAHHREFVSTIESKYLKQTKEVALEALRAMILTIAPIMPHIANEMLAELSNEQFTWPEFNEALTKDDKMTIVVQINGKRRGEFEVDIDTSEDAITAQAKDIAQKYIADKPIKKIVYVKNRMVSIAHG
ncbi:MAG: leucine--tRNA ligase [Alphaproteobacteria bacterium]|nr:MAG: leucine--tRNA ligase [Alphaproteobacteria bacterium]